MEIKQNLVSKEKYSIKCPYTMIAEFFVVHNTSNDASAENEIKYMITNNNEVSFHYAVDDIEIVQGIPEDRNTWNAGDGSNGKGNRKGISIEICYSKSGGERFDKAEQNAAKFIAYRLKEKGWGIDKVKKHQDFSNKYCPHRTLDLGWERFLNMIRAELGEQQTAIPTSTPAPVQSTGKIDVKYQVYAGKWYADIINYNEVNSNGYAGVYGQAISGFRGNTVGAEENAGKLIYRVHTKNGKWLGEITDREKDSSGDDFAGILGKAIDGIVIRSTKGTARYRVHVKGGNWLGWITQYNINDGINGYAGIFGKEIDGVQVEII